MYSSEKLPEAEVEVDRKIDKEEIVLFTKPINNLNHGDWRYIRRIIGRNKLREKAVDYLEN